MGMSWSTEPNTYTGSWNIAFPPGAAIDNDGNLLIAWTDGSQQLNLLYTNAANGGNFKSTVVAQNAFGSPSVAFSDGSFYVFWNDSTAGDLQGQLKYSLIEDPTALSSLTGNFLTGALSNDGPQVAPDGAGTIWVGWRGRGEDEQCYFSFLATEPDGESIWSTNFQVNGLCNSLYSPSVGYLPAASSQPATSGAFCSVFRGALNDPSLWSAFGPVTGGLTLLCQIPGSLLSSVS